jgi:flagellar hook assembly protein FlgD
LTVYDALGRVVAHPFTVDANTARDGLIQWDGRNDRGDPLPSGVYFVKLRAGHESHAQKVNLVR